MSGQIRIPRVNDHPGLCEVLPTLIVYGVRCAGPETLGPSDAMMKTSPGLPAGSSNCEPDDPETAARRFSFPLRSFVIDRKINFFPPKKICTSLHLAQTTMNVDATKRRGIAVCAQAIKATDTDCRETII